MNNNLTARRKLRDARHGERWKELISQEFSGDRWTQKGRVAWRHRLWRLTVRGESQCRIQALLKSSTNGRAVDASAYYGPAAFTRQKGAFRERNCKFNFLRRFDLFFSVLYSLLFPSVGVGFSPFPGTGFVLKPGRNLLLCVSKRPDPLFSTERFQNTLKGRLEERV